MTENKERELLPCATPLVERLRDVPKDARLHYDHTPTCTSVFPIGLMAHEAADVLTRTMPNVDELVEVHGEALFALSDRLRASGIISASDSVHQAYERVVETFQALATLKGTRP